MKIRRIVTPTLLTLAVLALGSGAAAAQPSHPADDPGPPLILDPVAAAVPMLAAAEPAQQARTLAWMLTVDDERRLVSLFPALHAERGVPLAERGLEARVHAVELLRGLERRGVAVDWPPSWLAVATAEPAAPEPNFVPPEILEELEQAAARDSLGAVEALERARRIRFEAAHMKEP